MEPLAFAIVASPCSPPTLGIKQVGELPRSIADTLATMIVHAFAQENLPYDARNPIEGQLGVRLVSGWTPLQAQSLTARSSTTC